MAKFIEVHFRDTPFLVNVDRISAIICENQLVKICFTTGAHVYTRETYEQIRKLVAVATGGIPMPPRETDIPG